MGIKIAPADEGQEGYKNGAMIFWSLLTPFFGTALGAACVFFLKKGLGDRVQRGLTGFASGVMVAASIWSLLIPAMEQSAGVGGWAFLPAVTGFWAGILFLLGLDHLIPHLHQRSQQAEGPRTQLQRSTMMVLAVTLHNIPEGMAVGVVYAGLLSGEGQITMMAALALSLGIAIQNFPEGAIISMPLRSEGMGKAKAFAGGVLSGVVEPVGGAADHPGRRAGGPGPALSAELCRRRYALCSGGGADPGDVPGGALQCGDAGLRPGLHFDDGIGRGAGLSRTARIVALFYIRELAFSNFFRQTGGTYNVEIHSSGQRNDVRHV